MVPEPSDYEAWAKAIADRIWERQQRALDEWKRIEEQAHQRAEEVTAKMTALLGEFDKLAEKMGQAPQETGDEQASEETEPDQPEPP